MIGSKLGNYMHGMEAKLLLLGDSYAVPVGDGWASVASHPWFNHCDGK